MIEPDVAILLILALVVIAVLAYLAVANWRMIRDVSRLRRNLKELEREAEIREDILRRQQDDSDDDDDA